MPQRKPHQNPKQHQNPQIPQQVMQNSSIQNNQLMQNSSKIPIQENIVNQNQFNTTFAIVIVLVLFIALFLLKFFFLNGRRNKNKPDLSGKTAIVTGGYNGIGYETALGLAKLNCKVIITGRMKNWRQGLERAFQIKQLSKNNNVFYFPLELDDLESVNKFVENFKQNNPERVDILVNNAGVMMIEKEQRTTDGVEMQFGVNYLGHFVLTQKILEIMKKTPQSRIINVSSRAYRYAKIDFEELENNNTSIKKYSRITAYANSKLANILFTKNLQIQLNQNQIQLNQNQIKAVCLHPGVVRTNLTRYLEEVFWIKSVKILLYPFYWFFTWSQEQGAQTTLHCCTELFEQLKSGEYYENCQVHQIYHKQLCDDALNKLKDYSRKFLN